MSLKGFHIFFIACSILLLFGFGYWAFQQYVSDHLLGYFWTSAFSVGAGARLFLYGFQINKRINV